jgi:isochorismate synthase
MLETILNKEKLYDLLTLGKKRAADGNRPILVSLVQPLRSETGAMEVFLNDFPHKGSGMFWGKPAAGLWMAGSGAAATLTAAGATRFRDIKAQAENILGSAVIEADSIRGTGPVFMGGFRYDTNIKKDDTWHDFSDALLTLPRFLFTRSGPDGWLTINTIVEAGTEISFAAATISEDLEFVDRPRMREDEQPPVFQLHQSPKADWQRRVHKALETIETGELVKVVLSRRKVLHARGSFSLDTALQRLCTHYPECVVFAISSGDTTFIGATPEDLAILEQGKLSVACLASSTARGEDEENDTRLQNQLFLSPKEQAEHNAVTSLVAEEMQELCTESRRDPEARPMKLKNIQHMLTSFTGRLKPGIDILDVVQRLHPTPAVAGVPTRRGLQLINELEGDRGWYAAPVGWFDHKGEGEFAVGIRSALVDGNSAFLYAGCGIVAGSDPEREYAETELKFEPMLNALGYDKNVF